MKKTFIILLVAFCFQNSFCQDEPEVIRVRKEVSEDTIFMYVEIMPSFPGGDSALFAFLAKRIVYPDSLKIKGVTGKVYCQFVVEKDGTITNIEIRRSPHIGFNPTVLNAMKNMPKWKTGLQMGKAVRVRFVLPIHFNLR